MRIERAEYEVALAERRYQECDPANRLVAGTLERRWNDAMQRLEAIKTEAAQFQSQKARVATPEQKAKILALARNLPRLWRAPATPAKDRKRMLRLLIRDITVEKLPAASRQVVLHVRWQGGICTDTTVTLPTPVIEALRYPTATVEQVRKLSQHLSDPQIVAHLNQKGLRSPTGKSFTLAMVKWIRYRYGIAPTSLKRPDELTVQQLAHRLGISPHVVYYW
ncbi:recombinase family protein, partial [Cupriavidus sp. LEh21]|nr:recombinase family protein [Cupriavidus sp. LEh21]